MHYPLCAIYSGQFTPFSLYKTKHNGGTSFIEVRGLRDIHVPPCVPLFMQFLMTLPMKAKGFLRACGIYSGSVSAFVMYLPDCRGLLLDACCFRGFCALCIFR